jgi:hypothetical protein
MSSKVEIFKNMPFSGKMGTSLCVLSWLWIIAICNFMLSDPGWALKLSIMVCILSFFLFQAQNWARWIAILGDGMGIILSAYFFIAGFVLIGTVNVMLFGGSIYFLMVPATSRYFKAQGQSGRQNG